MSICVVCFFFFKQKSAYEMRISDWSSDVCSSDLLAARIAEVDHALVGGAVGGELAFPAILPLRLDRGGLERLHARNALDEQCVVGGAARDLLVEPAAQGTGDDKRDDQLGGSGEPDEDGTERRRGGEGWGYGGRTREEAWE